MARTNSTQGRKRSQTTAYQENEASIEEANKRRQRNRLSQRAFRERRLAYLSNLEEVSKRANQTESERNKSLQTENAELRNSYLKLRKKVLGMICTLQEISEEAAIRLNINPNAQLGNAQPGQSESSLSDTNGRETSRNLIPEQLSGMIQARSDDNSNCAGLSSIHSSPSPDRILNELENDMLTDQFGDSSQWEVFGGTPTFSGPLNFVGLDDRRGSPGPSNMAPEFISHNVTTGKETYLMNPCNSRPGATNQDPTLEQAEVSSGENLFNDNSGSNQAAQITITQQDKHSVGQTAYTDSSVNNSNSVSQNWSTQILLRQVLPTPPVTGTFQRSLSRSLFLEHVDLLESLVHQKFQQIGEPDIGTKSSDVIATAVTLFHDCAWEGTARFWASSQARSILEAIMAWRCRPSDLTWTKLPQAWKPTPLQLYVPHSCIIDWFPHPGLRDTLILHYNDSDILDELFWDCMDCWVVRVADIASVLSDGSHGPGLIGVWNIIEAMNGSQASNKAVPFAPIPVELLEPGVDLPNLERRSEDIHAFTSNTSPIRNSDSGLKNTGDDSIHSSLYGQAGEWSPRPLDHILDSKDLARDLWYHLNMHDTTSKWLFDPYLFQKYPELKFPGYESLVAEGRSFRRASPKLGPTKLSSWIVNLYSKTILGNRTSEVDK